MAYTTWREMCGSGAATGTALITTPSCKRQAELHEIRPGRIHLLIRLNRRRRSACTAVARTYARTNIARDIWLEPVEKARSRPPVTTLGFAALSREKRKRSKLRTRLGGPIPPKIRVDFFVHLTRKVFMG